MGAIHPIQESVFNLLVSEAAVGQLSGHLSSSDAGGGEHGREEGHHTDCVTFEPYIQLTLYANLQGPPCMNLPPFPALGEKRQTSAAIGCTLMNI